MRRILVLLMLCIATPALAQTNVGIDYYQLGEFEKARSYFEAQIATNPALAYFYLGEIAFAEGDMERAAEFYNKCTAADPENVLCAIAQAKMILKSNPAAAEAVLAAASGKGNRNNVGVHLAIGRAYLDNNLPGRATIKVEDAKKINSKTPEIYILEGDIIAAQKDPSKIGDAAGKYEMSNYFDPEYRFGYMKTAQLYESNNSGVVTDMLKAIIDKYPDYLPAHEMLAKVYTNTGYYPQAIEIFKQYPPTTSQDLERYARALYFTDNLDEAQKIVTQGLQKDPNDFVLNRYQLYIYAKTENYTEGLQLTDRFFSLGEPSRYISLDYTQYAQLLKQAKRYGEAMAQYERAISIDPETPERYKEASEMAGEMKNYGLAGDLFQSYIDKKVKVSGSEYQGALADINSLGLYYYMAGTTIGRNPELIAELMNNTTLIERLLASDNELNPTTLTTDPAYFSKSYSTYFLHKASDTFSTLMERAPESYLGYRFKAAAENALNQDVTTSAAREVYEKMIAVISAYDNWQANKSQVAAMLEGYGYLLIYHFKTDNNAQAREYANKILLLNPEDANAKMILQEIGN